MNHPVFYNIEFGHGYIQMLAKEKREKTAIVTKVEKY